MRSEGIISVELSGCKGMTEGGVTYISDDETCISDSIAVDANRDKFRPQP